MTKSSAENGDREVIIRQREDHTEGRARYGQRDTDQVMVAPVRQP